jgi:TetR/AcrR family acrAB operon transcriptional repressor
MVRRTKEDSLETRRVIIAAAREVFYTNGVTRTTLEQIATAAGVTRGAIYWHFADKAELFYAMRDEVQIPLIDRSDLELEPGSLGLDPLQRVERFLEVVLDHVAGDEATQKTIEIMTFKCEYVGEFARDLEGIALIHRDLRDKLAKLYREARRLGILRAGVAPLCAASDTLLFMSGLIKIWVVDQDGTLVRKHASRLIVDHIEGKRAVTSAVQACKTATRRKIGGISRAAAK